MFDLNYYNTLCLIAKHIAFKFEEAKGWGMYGRANCHSLDSLSMCEIQAEYVDTQTKIKLWVMEGHYPYIMWVSSQHHFKKMALI